VTSQVPLVIAITRILIPVCGGELVAATDLQPKLIALTWINDIVDIAKAELLPHLKALVAAILPWQSNNVDPKLRELAMVCNESLLHGARFRQKFSLEDAIGPHASSLEASRRVTNGIPLGSPLFLPVHTVNCVQTLKANGQR
jgi:hypothetical protein